MLTNVGARTFKIEAAASVQGRIAEEGRADNAKRVGTTQQNTAPRYVGSILVNIRVCQIERTVRTHRDGAARLFGRIVANVGILR